MNAFNQNIRKKSAGFISENASLILEQ